MEPVEYVDAFGTILDIKDAIAFPDIDMGEPVLARGQIVGISGSKVQIEGDGGGTFTMPAKSVAKLAQ